MSTASSTSVNPPNYKIAQIENSSNNDFYVEHPGGTWLLVQAGTTLVLPLLQNPDSVINSGNSVDITISASEDGSSPKLLPLYNKSETAEEPKFCRDSACDNPITIGNGNQTGDEYEDLQPDQIRLDITGEGTADNPWLIGEVDMDPEPKYDIYSAELACGSEPAIITDENGTTYDLTAGNFKVINSDIMPILSDLSTERVGVSAPIPLQVCKQSAPTVCTVFHFFLHESGTSPNQMLQLKYTVGSSTRPILDAGLPFNAETLRFGSIRVTFASQTGSQPYTIPKVTLPAVLSDKERIPAEGYSICGSSHKVGGRLVDARGVPIADAKVKLQDCDLFKNDDLGTAVTTALGHFEMEWDAKQHKEWFTDKMPDLLFSAEKDGHKIPLKETEPFKNVTPQSDLFELHAQQGLF